MKFLCLFIWISFRKKTSVCFAKCHLFRQTCEHQKYFWKHNWFNKGCFGHCRNWHGYWVFLHIEQCNDLPETSKQYLPSAQFPMPKAKFIVSAICNCKAYQLIRCEKNELLATAWIIGGCVARSHVLIFSMIFLHDTLINIPEIFQWFTVFSVWLYSKWLTLTVDMLLFDKKML